MTDTKTSLDDWARLHVDWFDDPVFRAAAAQEAACVPLWPILIALAKGNSHVDRNPSGIIGRTLSDLAHDARVDVDSIKRALDVLVEGEFLSYSAGRLGALEIRLRSFPKWQSPRRSKADRDDRSRNGPGGKRAGKKQPNGDTPATGARPNGDALAAPDGDGDLDGDLDGDGSAPAGAHAAGGDLPPNPRTIGGQIRRAKGQLGDLAFHVELMIGRRTGDLTATDELTKFWAPACNLLADHGRDRLRSALGVAGTEAAFSMKFVASVCDRLAADTNRPSLALVAGGMSADDLAALDAVEGGDDA